MPSPSRELACPAPKEQLAGHDGMQRGSPGACCEECMRVQLRRKCGGVAVRLQAQKCGEAGCKGWLLEQRSDCLGEEGQTWACTDCGASVPSRAATDGPPGSQDRADALRIRWQQALSAVRAKVQCAGVSREQPNFAIRCLQRRVAHAVAAGCNRRARQGESSGFLMV